MRDTCASRCSHKAFFELLRKYTNAAVKGDGRPHAMPLYPPSHTRALRGDKHPRMAASVVFGEAPALGLVSGPACI